MTPSTTTPAQAFLLAGEIAEGTLPRKNLGEQDKNARRLALLGALTYAAPGWPSALKDPLAGISDPKAELALIRQKKSKLPAKLRKIILHYYGDPH